MLKTIPLTVVKKADLDRPAQVVMQSESDVRCPKERDLSAIRDDWTRAAEMKRQLQAEEDKKIFYAG